MELEYLTKAELSAYLDSPLAVKGVVVAVPFTQAAAAQQAMQLMASRASAKAPKAPNALVAPATPLEGLVVGVHDSEGDGFIHMTNLIFRATKSPWFVYSAQDVMAGRDWLSLALSAMGSAHELLGFNDGKWAGALASFGLVRRSWAQKNYSGDLFYPKYAQHYADCELTLLAMQEQVYAYEPNSVLMEVDWDKDRMSTNAVDRALFLARRAQGFDGRVSHEALLNLYS